MLTQNPQGLRMPGPRRRGRVGKRPRCLFCVQAACHITMFLGTQWSLRAPGDRGRRPVRAGRSDHHIEGEASSALGLTDALVLLQALIDERADENISPPAIRTGQIAGRARRSNKSEL